ncbi:MAG: hypothetical protein QXT91_00560 [Candidatus Caldarchaeum sp.]
MEKVEGFSAVRFERTLKKWSPGKDPQRDEPDEVLTIIEWRDGKTMALLPPGESFRREVEFLQKSGRLLELEKKIKSGDLQRASIDIVLLPSRGEREEKKEKKGQQRTGV